MAKREKDDKDDKDQEPKKDHTSPQADGDDRGTATDETEGQEEGEPSGE